MIVLLKKSVNAICRLHQFAPKFLRAKIIALCFMYLHFLTANFAGNNQNKQVLISAAYSDWYLLVPANYFPNIYLVPLNDREI